VQSLRTVLLNTLETIFGKNQVEARTGAASPTVRAYHHPNLFTLGASWPQDMEPMAKKHQDMGISVRFHNSLMG
jgi:hypothetical protein